MLGGGGISATGDIKGTLLSAPPVRRPRNVLRNTRAGEGPPTPGLQLSPALGGEGGRPALERPLIHRLVWGSGAGLAAPELFRCRAFTCVA